MMWTEKYRVDQVDGFFGNEKPRIVLLNWLKKWVKGTKPILIIGPPGTGKTSYVKSLVSLLDFDLVELNASDLRNKINLEDIISPLLSNASIFGKKMILFLDEVDGISGRDDFGGLSFLSNILKNSEIPIIMAANSKNYKIKEIIKNSKVVEFNLLSSFSCFLLIQYILSMENKDLDTSEKIDLIRRSNGDARTLINILQTQIEGNYLSFSNSYNDMSIEECVNKFFLTDDITETKRILQSSSIRYSTPKYGYTPEERSKDFLNALHSSIVVIEKKIPTNDLANILDGLSQIDLFVNRIYQNRTWNLLKYVNDILLLKLFKVSRDQGIKYNQYSIPFPLIGSIFMRGQSLKPLRMELSRIFHTSSSKIGLFYYSNFILILKNSEIDSLNLNTSDDSKLMEVIEKEKEKLKIKSIEKKF